MEKKIVTVFGATGSLGLKIVKELFNQGAHVRAVVRNTSNRAKLEMLGVTEFVTADMLDSQSLQKSLSLSPKADAVISSAAGYTRHTRGDNSETDTEGYRNLIDAVKAAGIPRFVLISILECDKATNVPHFYHKYLAEKYLVEKGQPFIALRAGAFLDQAKDVVLPKIQKGIYPVFFPDATFGMIYTPDLARYAALAATVLPDSAVNITVDVGWDQPATGAGIAQSFSKLLGKNVVVKPAVPPFAARVILPFLSLFNESIKDINKMVKWVKSGEYTSKNTLKQKELFGDLPSIEEAVRRYSKDRGLI